MQGYERNDGWEMGMKNDAGENGENDKAGIGKY